MFGTEYFDISRIYHSTMSIFGWSVCDIIAISRLAEKVHTAYKDAPKNYKHISEEVVALQLLIDKVVQHVKSTPISNNDHHDGLKVLKDCQGLLEDLNSLIEKYEIIRYSRDARVFERDYLGKGIPDLQVRLTSSTALLSDFVQRLVVPPVSLQQPYGY